MSGKPIAPLDADGKGIPAEHALEDVWKVRRRFVRKTEIHASRKFCRKNRTMPVLIFNTIVGEI